MSQLHLGRLRDLVVLVEAFVTTQRLFETHLQKPGFKWTILFRTQIPNGKAIGLKHDIQVQ